ncbi:MAG: hypothetical protein FWH14_08035 [Oscillospiraceae bacterium]|nr:hypothetical protein [Oscillospiraceae bacterium]
MSRETICLNGYWDFALCPDCDLTKLPQSYDDTKILVPSPFNINAFEQVQTRNVGGENVILKGGESNLFPEYPSEWTESRGGFYRREFFIPEEWKDRKVTMKFDAVLFYSECYINRKLAYTDCDGFLPFEFEINDYIEFGKNNEVIIGAKNAMCFQYQADGRNKLEYPVGSFWGESATGIWQDVFLNTYPRSHIKDVFVTTDIFSTSCKVKTEFEGVFPDGAMVSYKLKEYKGDKEFDFKSTSVEIKADGFVLDYAFDYSAYKDQIKLWSDESPNLYYITVAVSKDGQVLDSKTVRFGFRSIEVRGKKVYLNGYPVRLRQDGWHYFGFMYQNEEYASKWYKAVKEANGNCVRLHAQVYPELFLNVADEEGMLIVDESSIWASHCKFHHSDKFIDNCKLHVERMVKRDRNHPSVIVWSVENECMMAYGVSHDKAVKDVNELVEKLKPIAEHARRFDDSRLVSADGSRDLGGSCDLYSLHYPGIHGPETDKPVTIGEMGSMYYSTPAVASHYRGQDTFYSAHNRLDGIGKEVFEALKHQRKWAAQVCVFNIAYYALKPQRYTERILKYEDYTTPGVKIGKIGEYMTTINAGYDPDLPDYEPSVLFRWVKEAWITERTFFESERRAFYSNEKASMRISIFNDTKSDNDYKLYTWLYDGENVISKSSKDISIGAVEYVLEDIEFDTPNAEEVEEYRLVLSLVRDGQTVYTDSTDVKIFNKEYLLDSVKRHGKIAVAGNAEIDLDGFEKITDFADDKYAAVMIYDGLSGQLYDKITAGTTPVIDFTCGNPRLMGKIQDKIVKKGFFTDIEYNIDQNLTEFDLMARVEELFARRCMKADIGGNTLQLITNGNGEPVVTELIGENQPYIASTMVWDDMGDPVMLQLAANAIEYLSSQAEELTDCVVITDEDSELYTYLKSVGLEFSLVSPSDKPAIKRLRDKEVIIADGSVKCEYVNELTCDNAENLYIFGLKDENIPKQMLCFFNVTEKNVYQFRLWDYDRTTDSVLASDLYGADPSNLFAVSKNPITIHDYNKCESIAITPDIDWRAWNNIGEDRKLVTIRRTELNANPNLTLICYLPFNGMNVYINQLDITNDNDKVRVIGKKILTNLGLRLQSGEVDESVTIYDNGLKKSLLIKDGNLSEFDLKYKRSIEQGDCEFVVYINSPQDRTDFLLNPDTIYMDYRSGFETEALLDGAEISKGKDIAGFALPLKSGQNKLVFKQKRDTVSDEMFNLRFRRKNNQPLDLKFSLSE